jgi:hypothetical protein
VSGGTQVIGLARRWSGSALAGARGPSEVAALDRMDLSVVLLTLVVVV